MTFCKTQGKNISFVIESYDASIEKIPEGWSLAWKKSPHRRNENLVKTSAWLNDLWPAENCCYTLARYLYSSQHSQPRQDALKRSDLQVTKSMNLLGNHLLKREDHTPGNCNRSHSTTVLLLLTRHAALCISARYLICAWHEPHLHIHISLYWNLIIQHLNVIFQ